MFHTYATSVQTSHGRARGDHVGQCKDSLRLNLIIQRLWVTKSCLLSGNGGHGFLSATTTRSVSFCPVAALPLLRSSVLRPWGPWMLCVASFHPCLTTCRSLHPRRSSVRHLVSGRRTSGHVLQYRPVRLHPAVNLWLNECIFNVTAVEHSMKVGYEKCHFPSQWPCSMWTPCYSRKGLWQINVNRDFSAPSWESSTDKSN